MTEGSGFGERGCVARGTREPRCWHSSVGIVLASFSDSVEGFSMLSDASWRSTLPLSPSPLPVSRSFRHQYPNGERGRWPGELFRDRHRPRSPELPHSRKKASAKSLPSVLAFQTSRKNSPGQGPLSPAGCRSRKDQDSGRGEGERGCIVRGTREPRRRHSSVRNRSGKLLRFGRRFLDVVKRVLTIVVAPLPVSRSFRHQHPNGERGRCPGELFRDRHRPRSPELLYSRNRQASSIRSTTAWMFSSTS